MSDTDRTDFLWPVRIYYEDTDAAGIVYHANYLKFFERARTEWLRRLGFEQHLIVKTFGIQFVVRSMTLDYAKPALFDDEVTIVSNVMKIGRASLAFSQKVVRDDETLCAAKVKCGCIDVNSMRPCKIPPAIYSEINHAC